MSSGSVASVMSFTLRASPVNKQGLTWPANSVVAVRVSAALTHSSPPCLARRIAWNAFLPHLADDAETPDAA